MDYSELFTSIFEVCIIPLLGILTTFLVTFLRSKNKELQAQMDNDLAKKYMDLLTDTITNCVIATNQTYVESLKASGSFDEEAQKKAFENTCNNVIKILGDDATKYLTNIVGDLNSFIATKVEAEVNKNKK